MWKRKNLAFFILKKARFIFMLFITQFRGIGTRRKKEIRRDLCISASRLLVVFDLLVGVDDFFDEAVSDDVFVVEVDDADAFNVFEDE